MLIHLLFALLKRNWRWVAVGLPSLLLCPATAQTLPVADSANVVLVTIDGFRWQELFGGTDARILARDPRGPPPATRL